MMKIKITASNGKTYDFMNFGKNGDFLTVEYENKDGDKLTYMIRITPKNRIVMN